MGNDEKAIPKSEKLTESFVGLPNWEEVKHTIYGYWVEANYWLYRVNQSRIQVPGNQEYGSSGVAFKSSLLRLYSALRPKLLFHESAPCVKELISNKDGKTVYTLDFYLVHPGKLEFLDAVHYFMLLTEFIEVDGIPHYELKKFDPSHGFTGMLD